MINKSKTYILPLLMDYIDIKYFNELNNTYVFLEDYDTELIVLSYNNSLQQNFEYEDYLRDLKNSDLFIENFKSNDGSIIFVFKIPEKYSNDYNKFLCGKYSKINSKTKSLIINTISTRYGKINNNIVKKIKDVLYLGSDLRKDLEIKFAMKIPEDWELSGIIDTNRETFNVNNE